MISDFFLNKRMRFLVWITGILFLAQATRRDLNDSDKKLPQTTTVAKAFVDIECHAEDSYNFMFVKVDTTESITIAECDPQADAKVCHLNIPTKDNLTYTIQKTSPGCWSLRVYTISEDVYGRYQCITSRNITPRPRGATTTTPQSTGSTTTAPQSTGATTTHVVCSQESTNKCENYYPFLVALLVILLVIGVLVILLVIRGFKSTEVSFPFARDCLKKKQGQCQTKAKERRKLRNRRQNRSNGIQESGSEDDILLPEHSGRTRQNNPAEYHEQPEIEIASEYGMANIHQIPHGVNLIYAAARSELVVVSGDSHETPPIVPVVTPPIVPVVTPPIVPVVTSTTVQVE